MSTFRDVPWNGPFYKKHGFRELRPAEFELTPVGMGLEAEHRLEQQIWGAGGPCLGRARDGIGDRNARRGAVELILNHLVDGPGEYVVVDMTAGAAQSISQFWK